MAKPGRSGLGAMTGVRWHRHRHLPLAVVLLVYALSRAIAHLAFGLRFDASSLGWFWQYLDPLLLREDPWQSLYYLHAQPPLWNFYLAAVLTSPAGDPTLLFATSFLLFGVVLHVGIYALLDALGVRPALAAGAAVLFAVSPASLLYECWLFYTQPLAALLVASGLVLHRLVARGARPADALLFFGLLAAAALTRSLFHPAWLVAIAAAVALGLPGARRRVLLCAALPLLLVVGLQLKNGLLFDSFSTSSWLGMNLARITTDLTPLAEREQLHRDGVLSAVALVPAFSPLGDYPAQLIPADSPVHPALRAERKTSRAPNFNHVAYVSISRSYLHDALALIRREPGRYLANVGRAWLLFSWPPTDYWFLEPNRLRIAGWEELWNAVAYGVASTFTSETIAYDRRDPPYLRHRASLFWIPFALAALALGSRDGWRECRAEGARRADGITLLFLASTVLYVAFVGNALDFYENNRFRFMVEPLIFVLGFRALDRALVAAGRTGSGRRMRAQPGASTKSASARATASGFPRATS